MFSIIIFSKDRALQLDSLLRSIRDNFKIPFDKIYILFHTSNTIFAKGYEILAERNYFNNINWVKENHFRDDIYEIINGLTDDGMIMFVVDDDIFFRPFKDNSLLDHLSNRHLFISLRLSRKYNNMQNPRIPKFINKSKYLEWKWYTLINKKKKKNHWHYPFSVDGNIFNTTHIKKY